MPPSSSASPTTAMTTEARDAAIKQAKRYIRETVRNDWSFETDTLQAHPALPDLEEREFREWRQREYDESSSELEPQGRCPVAASVTVGGISVQNHNHNPVAEEEAGLSSSERRVKRRRDMLEEMKWNEGLRVWVARRDAWAGARRKKDVEGDDQDEEPQSQFESGKGKQSQVDRSTEKEEEGKDEREEDPTSTLSAPTTDHHDPASSINNNDSTNLATKTETHLSISEKELEPEPEKEEEKQSTDTAITEPEPSASASATTPTKTTQDTTATTPDEPLVPIAPPLLPPDNPIRASINPTLYPSIYSKVVVQGLTPTVPINLSDMTRSLVQGWKADGQWPPRPTPVLPGDNVVVHRRDRDRGTATAGAGASANAGAGAGAPPTLTTSKSSTGAGQNNDAPSSPDTKKRSTVANAMRKVLHFSGIHRRHGSSNVESAAQPSIPVVEEKAPGK